MYSSNLECLGIPQGGVVLPMTANEGQCIAVVYLIRSSLCNDKPEASLNQHFFIIVDYKTTH